MSLRCVYMAESYRLIMLAQLNSLGFSLLFTFRARSLSETAREEIVEWNCENDRTNGTGDDDDWRLVIQFRFAVVVARHRSCATFMETYYVWNDHIVGLCQSKLRSNEKTLDESASVRFNDFRWISEWFQSGHDECVWRNSVQKVLTGR